MCGLCEEHLLFLQGCVSVCEKHPIVICVHVCEEQPAVVVVPMCLCMRTTHALVSVFLCDEPPVDCIPQRNILWWYVCDCVFMCEEQPVVVCVSLCEEPFRWCIHGRTSPQWCGVGGAAPLPVVARCSLGHLHKVLLV